MVELLLQEGADRESRDILGRTAVDIATALGHHAVAAVLQAGNISELSSMSHMGCGVLPNDIPEISPPHSAQATPHTSYITLQVK